MLLSTVFRGIIIALLTMAYVSIERVGGELNMTFMIEITLLFRALSKLYNCPLTASIESLVLLYSPSLQVLTLASFVLNRAMILQRKATYILVSIITAMKNKKQRFTSQGLCFVLEFTVLLPVTIFVLLVTTVLDCATIPYLGFAFFIIGYPKPVRGWSNLTPAEANPNDSRSDGHIYQAMMP
jgi:hypothetical protein